MNLELKPTRENIIETIEKDILGRNIVLKRFIKMLYLLKDFNIISLNGEWGAGKTFFVQQSIEIIKILNKSNLECDEKLKKIINDIKNVQLQDITTEGNLYPIYFNAWEYDSNEDPLITLIYSIIDQNPKLKDFDTENKSNSIREKIIKLLSSFKVGASFQDEYSRSFGFEIQYTGKEDKKLTKDVYSIEKTKETFKDLLDEIMIENTNKLVIFIDELDRCNPIFAVKLLERIKHFFDDERFIFVFSTNLNELQHTIKKFYGEGMDGYSYLDKFFDLQFTLRNINIENYINSLNIVNMYTGRYFDMCVKEMCLQFGFSLRKINRYLGLIDLVYDYIYQDNRRNALLAKNILFPILLAIKYYDINIYNKIISGKGEEELKTIILENKEMIAIFNDFFNTEKSETELTFDFSDLYNAIFTNKQEIGYMSKVIGDKDIEFAMERKTLFDMLSFINEFVKI